MEEQKKYVCPLCGTEYDTPKTMAHCILECEEKQRAEEERLKRERLDQEKDKRWNEVVATGERYKTLFDKFIEDYPHDPWKTASKLQDIFWGW